MERKNQVLDGLYKPFYKIDHWLLTFFSYFNGIKLGHACHARITFIQKVLTIFTLTEKNGQFFAADVSKHDKSFLGAFFYLCPVGP